MKQYDNFPPFHKRRGRKLTDMVTIRLITGDTDIAFFEKKRGDKIRCHAEFYKEIELELVESWHPIKVINHVVY